MLYLGVHQVDGGVVVESCGHLHDGERIHQLHHVAVGTLALQARLSDDALLLSGLRLGPLVHLREEGLVLRLQVGQPVVEPGGGERCRGLLVGLQLLNHLLDGGGLLHILVGGGERVFVADELQILRARLLRLVGRGGHGLQGVEIGREGGVAGLVERVDVLRLRPLAGLGVGIVEGGVGRGVGCPHGREGAHERGVALHDGLHLAEETQRGGDVHPRGVDCCDLLCFDVHSV